MVTRIRAAYTRKNIVLYNTLNTKPQKGVFTKDLTRNPGWIPQWHVYLYDIIWHIQQLYIGYCVPLIVFRLGGCRPPGFNPPRGVRPRVRLSVYVYIYAYMMRRFSPARHRRSSCHRGNGSVRDTVFVWKGQKKYRYWYTDRP